MIYGGISVGVFLFCKKYLGYSIQKEAAFFRILPVSLKYLWSLLKNIILSDIAVLKIIYTKENTTHPYIVKFHSGINSDFLNMVLANSITITPGTITVDQTGDYFTVHCIQRSIADGIENSEFVSILKEMEEKS